MAFLCTEINLLNAVTMYLPRDESNVASLVLYAIRRTASVTKAASPHEEAQGFFVLRDVRD